VFYIIKKLKMAYAGHLAGIPKKRWSRRISFWVPYKLGRKVGRLANSWREEILRRVGFTKIVRDGVVYACDMVGLERGGINQ